MIRIAIVEDDDKYAEILEDYITKYANDNPVTVNCVRHCNALTLIQNYRSEYNVILMDIDLPVMSGMDAAKKIRETDKSVVIIFITNLAQYACEGYGVEALDFVVKPVTYPDFAMKFARAVSRVESVKEREFSIPVVGGVYRIFPDKIIYVEVMSHKILYHTVEKVIESRESLVSVEKRLSESKFLRTGKSFIVNPKHIVLVEGLKIGLTGGEEIYLSHGRRREFLKELATWKSGR